MGYISSGRSIIAALAATAALGGCQTMVQQDWESAPTMRPLPASYVEVASSELTRVCGEHPGILFGCARRDYVALTCVIYTGPNPQVWLLDHERKHCAGWNHGTVTAAASVPLDLSPGGG